MKSKQNLSKRVLFNLTYERLLAEFPNSKCALDYKTPLDLLIATMLSAQCTDASVNRVTKVLFSKYRTVEDYIRADISELEFHLKSLGLFRTKAKNIKLASQRIAEQFLGKVPNNMEDLISLAGVGRKTANVVLGNIFSIMEGIVVDTHVKRVTNLIGFTKEQDPVKIEKDLLKIVPQAKRLHFVHLIIDHGRKTCIARRPKCSTCVLKNICQYGKKIAPNLT